MHMDEWVDGAHEDKAGKLDGYPPPYRDFNVSPVNLVLISYCV